MALAPVIGLMFLLGLVPQLIVDTINPTVAEPAGALEILDVMAWTIYISFAGALVSALLPKDKPALARWFALAVAVAGLAIAVAGFAAGMGQGRAGLCRRALGALHGHSLSACRRRHQPRARSAHRHRLGCRRSLQLEHRTPHQSVLRVLSRAHRRRLRRLS